MMTTVDEDFRAMLLDDETIASYTQAIAQNAIPESSDQPYIWFQIQTEDTPVDMSGVADVTETRFAVECVALDIAVAAAIGRRVKALCNGFAGTMNESTVVQGMFVEDAADDYVPQNQFQDERLSIVSLDVQVFH